MKELEEMEEVKVEIDKEAFTPKKLTCHGKQMKKTYIEIGLENDVFIKVGGFECKECGKNYLGMDSSRKLDRAMIVSRALSKDFKLRRNLSFDGDNYTFRIPKEFTHDVKNRKIEIVPLGANEFCAVVE